MKRFDILTLFPEVVEHYLTTSILGTAQEKKLIEPHVWNIRDFTTDKHRTVDDTPYGGGAGMVMKVEPIDRTLQAVKQDLQSITSPLQPRIIVLSAKGEQLTQKKAQEYARLDQLTLICGRYEGVDQRVMDYLADEELSIGPYILAGGELAALVVIEAVARLLPGVLGNPASLEEESFVAPHTTTYPLQPTTYVEYPQYTKPEEYKGWKVPEVLLSGNHAEIKKWREERRGRHS